MRNQPQAQAAQAAQNRQNGQNGQNRVHNSLCAEMGRDTCFYYQEFSGKFWASFCCLGILLTVILIPLSINDVSHDQYAIKYDSLTNKVSDSIVEEGKHVFTPATELFYYNKIVKTISFEDFTCLTSDGINIEMNLDIQYQLYKDQLFDLFWEFGEEGNVKQFMRDITQDSVRDTCGKYEALDFLENRDGIQSDMETSLSYDFNISTAHAELTFLELANYEYPHILNQAIDEKQSALQDIEIAESEEEGQLTIANTAKAVAESEALTLIDQAEGTATATNTAANEEIESIAEVWEARKSTYESLMATLGMTVDEFVEEYLYGVILNNAQNAYTNIV